MSPEADLNLEKDLQDVKKQKNKQRKHILVLWSGFFNEWKLPTLSTIKLLDYC